jgi:hypothetical protein
MPRNIPEQRRSHLHRAGSLKPHIILGSSRQLFKHTAMKEWKPQEKSVTKIFQGILITAVLVNKTLRTESGVVNLAMSEINFQLTL